MLEPIPSVNLPSYSEVGYSLKLSAQGSLKDNIPNLSYHQRGWARVLPFCILGGRLVVVGCSIHAAGVDILFRVDAIIKSLDRDIIVQEGIGHQFPPPQSWLKNEIQLVSY